MSDTEPNWSDYKWRAGQVASRPLRRDTVVHYPDNVCADHEFGSDWPCRECGK